MSKTPTLASVSGTTLSGGQLKTFLTGIVAAFRTAGMQETDRATITSDTTLTVQNCGLVLVDCTGGNVALTLPTSGSTTDDAIYNIRRLDSTTNTLTVTRGASDTIEGASTALRITARGVVGIQLPAGDTDWKITNRSSGTVGYGPGSDIASSATLDVTTRTGNIVRITGTAATSAITMNNGDEVVCIAVGAWPITYHSTNMPLPTGASITCAAGDIVIFRKDANGSFSIQLVEKNLGPAFSAYSTANRSIGGPGSPPGTKLTMDAEFFDTNSCFDTSTSRFTPNVRGYYQINFKGVASEITTGGVNMTVSLVKNGTSISDLSIRDDTGQPRNMSFSEDVFMNGSTDYLEIYGNVNAATSINFIGSSVGFKFSGFLARRG